MGLEQTKDFNFIIDKASAEDSFDGGHQRVADAMWNFIQENQGGITMGLEGKWGSGKSTIIEMLKQKCDPKNNHLLFVFDAWAHENDPLRRSFLTTLMKFLSKYYWLDEEISNYEISKLDGIHSKTNTKSRPVLSNTGIVAAITTIFLFPLGSRLLDIAISKELCFTFGCGKLSWLFIIGLVLILSPFLGTFISYTIEFKKKKNCKNIKSDTKKDNSSTLKNNYANGVGTSAMLSYLLTNKGETETNTDTYQTPNPTSVEFEDLFSKIFNVYLCGEVKNKKWKLIIVLDNLDRIESDKALELLSTLQIYLQYQQRINEKDDCPYKKIWTIIPYDSLGMMRIWGKNADNNLVISMIEKRFQVRFFAPPIIFSGSKDFMINKLKESFPGSVEYQELDDIYNIYYSFCESPIHFRSERENNNTNYENERITEISPRDVIVFINQMGISFLQWKEKIPLASLALFTLLKTKKTNLNIQELLLKSDDIKLIELSNLNTFLDEKWKNHLAMLWFNVEEKKALVILLQKEVAHALKNGDSLRINNLLSDYPALVDVVESIILDKKSNYFKLSQDILGVIYVINQSNLLKSFKENKRNLNTLLCHLINRIPGSYTEGFDSKLADWMINFVDLYEKENLLSLYESNIIEEIDKLIFEYRKVDLEKDNSKMIKEWLFGIQIFVDYLDQKHISFYDIDKRRFPYLDPPFLVYVWGILEESKINNKHWILFKPDLEDDNFEDVLDKVYKIYADSTTITPNTKELRSVEEIKTLKLYSLSIKEYRSSLEIAKHFFPDFPFQITATILLNKLAENPENPEVFSSAENINEYFIILELLLTPKILKSKFINPNDANIFLSYFEFVLSKDNLNSVLGLILYFIIKCSPNLNQTHENEKRTNIQKHINGSLLQKPDESESIISKFCEVIKKYEDVDSLYTLYSLNLNSINWVTECLKRFLEEALNPEAQCDLPTILEFIINNWEKISQKASDVTKHNVISIISQSEEYFGYALNYEDLNLKYKFLSGCVNENILSTRNYENLVNFLNDVQVDDWLKYFDNSEVIAFLSRLKATYPSLSLDQKFSTAIEQHAESVNLSQVSINDDQSKYWGQITLLHSDQKVFFNEIYNICERNNWNISKKFLELYGEYLFSRHQLTRSKNKKEFIGKVLRNQLRNNPVESIPFINSFFNSINKNLWSKLGDNQGDRHSLVNEIKNLIDDPGITIENKKLLNQILDLSFISEKNEN